MCCKECTTCSQGPGCVDSQDEHVRPLHECLPRVCFGRVHVVLKGSHIWGDRVIYDLRCRIRDAQYMMYDATTRYGLYDQTPACTAVSRGVNKHIEAGVGVGRLEVIMCVQHRCGSMEDTLCGSSTSTDK
jgi:hypothetical protein